MKVEETGSAMDTIYSNKKYLQSLNAADYYRANTTLRPSVSRALERRSRFHFYKRNFVSMMSTVDLRLLAHSINLMLQLQR